MGVPSASGYGPGDGDHAKGFAVDVGIYVQGTGTARSIVAGAVGGVVGAVAAGSGKAAAGSPLASGQLGYLAVGADAVVLHGAKRKVALGGFKATDDVLATVPRAQIAGARFEKGKIVGTLEVGLVDGTVWTFEVPKVGNKTLDQAVSAMSSPGGAFGA